MISKYTREKTGYYYTNIPTGRRQPSGKPEYKKLRAKTIKALDQKVEDYKRDMLLGISGDKKTLDEWYEIWFSAYKGSCKPTTQSWYDSLYRTHISPALGTYTLTTVTEAQCQRLITNLAKARAASTVTGIRKMLYSIFDAAARNRLIAYNPAARLDVKGARKTESRRALTEEERQAYLARITAERECPTAPWDVPTFAALLYFFGLRRGEALALTGNDISDDTISISRSVTYPGNNMPHVQDTTKTAAGVRELPIPAAARTYIDFAALRAKGSSYIFTTDGSSPLSLHVHTRHWNKFIDAALGPDTPVTEHFLRHNYCCLLFESGVSLPSAQYYMGHGSSKVTLDIYTHFTSQLRDEDKKKVANL
jgi:integrase